MIALDDDCEWYLVYHMCDTRSLFNLMSTCRHFRASLRALTTTSSAWPRLGPAVTVKNVPMLLKHFPQLHTFPEIEPGGKGMRVSLPMYLQLEGTGQLQHALRRIGLQNLTPNALRYAVSQPTLQHVVILHASGRGMRDCMKRQAHHTANHLTLSTNLSPRRVLKWLDITINHSLRWLHLQVHWLNAEHHIVRLLPRSIQWLCIHNSVGGSDTLEWFWTLLTEFKLKECRLLQCFDVAGDYGQEVIHDIISMDAVRVPRVMGLDPCAVSVASRILEQGGQLCGCCTTFFSSEQEAVADLRHRYSEQIVTCCDGSC